MVVFQKVAVDENGTATAIFETYGMGLGTYNIYVRDTMRTVGWGYTIYDFYDWEPSAMTEDWLRDDILIIDNVSIVEKAKTILKVEDGSASTGETTKVNITAMDVTDLANFDITVEYDPSVVNVTGVSVNPSFGASVCNLEHASEGWVRIASLNTDEGQNGNVWLATLTLKALGNSGDKSYLNLTVNAILDSYEVDIPFTVQNGTFTVGLPMNGDINGDNKLDLKDAIYLAKHVVGLPGYEQIHADGDINCDGKTDLKDVIYLAKHVVGLPGYEQIYPCE